MNLFDYLNESELVLEGTGTESIKKFFGKDMESAIKITKDANSLYKAKKYKAAKTKYDEAGKKFTDIYKEINDFPTDVWSTLLSNTIGAAYILNIFNFVESVQRLCVEKDWWKPTTYITDLITRFKELFKEVTNRKDLNFVRMNTISAVKYLADFCERRSRDCSGYTNERYEGDAGLFAFMEDTSELKPQGKSDVDYAPSNEPISGDDFGTPPTEKQPDYVPSGYEAEKPENCTNYSTLGNHDEEIDYMNKAGKTLDDERVDECGSLFDYLNPNGEMYTEADDRCKSHDYVDKSYNDSVDKESSAVDAMDKHDRRHPDKKITDKKIAEACDFDVQ